MKEISIDISQQKSRSIDNELLKKMDVVIALYDNALVSCMWTPPQIKRIHHSRESGNPEKTGFRVKHEMTRIS
jgi:protein-tyrosine-phosphatase